MTFRTASPQDQVNRDPPVSNGWATIIPAIPEVNSFLSMNKYATGPSTVPATVPAVKSIVGSRSTTGG